MKAAVVSIEPLGDSGDGFAIQIEFSDEGEEFPRSAGVEIWIKDQMAAGMTVQDLEEQALSDAYMFLKEILDSRSDEG